MGVVTMIPGVVPIPWLILHFWEPHPIFDPSGFTMNDSSCRILEFLLILQLHYIYIYIYISVSLCVCVRVCVCVEGT